MTAALPITVYDAETRVLRQARDQGAQLARLRSPVLTALERAALDLYELLERKSRVIPRLDSPAIVFMGGQVDGLLVLRRDGIEILREPFKTEDLLERVAAILIKDACGPGAPTVLSRQFVRQHPEMLTPDWIILRRDIRSWVTRSI